MTENAKTERPFTLTDRMSGRSSDELEFEPDAAPEAKITKFLAAHRHAELAANIVARDENPPSSIGTRQDVKLAMGDLQLSASFHANTISESELVQALERKFIEIRDVANVRKAKANNSVKPVSGRSKKHES